MYLLRKEASNYRDFQRQNGGKQVITISIIEISNDVGGGGGKKCSISDQQKPSMHEYESPIS